MKTKALLPLLLALVCTQGCTTWQLTRSTLAQGKTLTDLEYSMVLDNVAMFRSFGTTNAIPWHLSFSSGEVTIKDTVTAGNPSLSYAWDPIGRTFGASASRSWQENWTATPVTDQSSLKKLTGTYATLADCCKTKWIKDGLGIDPDTIASGSFNGTHVYVNKADLFQLTTNTILILSEVIPAGTSLLLPGPTQTIR